MRMWTILLPLAAGVVAFVQGVSLWRVHEATWEPDSLPSWVATADGGGDLDTILIQGGIGAAPEWRDTLRWWTGTWVGQVPFFRPLTSYVFWFEARAFGDREPSYTFCALIAHALATAAFAWCALQVARRFGVGWCALAAGAAVWLWLDGWPIFFHREATCAAVYGLWKNQPDSLAAAFACLAIGLWCLKRTRWALLAFLGALGFKEAAIFVPIAVLAIVMVEGERRRAWPWVATTVVYLAYRALALGSALGYTYGSNESWPYRFLVSAFGPLGENVALSRWPVLVLSGLSLAALGIGPRIARRGLWPAMAAAIVWLAALGFVCALVGGGRSWAEGMWLALDASMLESSFGLVAFAVLLWAAWRRALALVAGGLAWSLGALAPTLASPGPMHRFYVVDGGYALVLACGLAWLLGPRNAGVVADVETPGAGSVPAQSDEKGPPGS